MSLLTSIVAENIKAAHRGVTDFIVNIDPEGASEAQISEMIANVDSAASIAAKAEQNAQAAEKARDELKVKLDQYIKAAEILSAEIEGLPEGAKRNSKETGLTKIINDAETLKSQYADAVAVADDNRSYAKERLEVHNLGTQKLTTLRTRLEASRREQERARQEATRAAERKREQLSSAGITRGDDHSEVALAAMERKTAQLRQQAAADSLTSGALSKKSEGDDEATRALAAASGTAPSLQGDIKSRLAALKG